MVTFPQDPTFCEKNSHSYSPCQAAKRRFFNDLTKLMAI
jgi:hypothetical protein